MQFAAAHHLEDISGAGFFHAQRDIGEQLFFQALAQIARSDVLTFAAGKRRGVHRELHGDSGLINHNAGQRRRILHRSNGLADGDALNAGHGHNIAQLGLLNIYAAQPAEAEQFGDACILQRAIELGDGHFFAGAQGAVEDARDGQPAEVVAVIEVGHQHLQRRRGIPGGERNSFQNRLKQRLQIRAWLIYRERSGSGLGVGVENGKFELLFARIEVNEQIVDFVEHFLRPGIGAVNLVDDHYGRQPGFQRLAQHIAGLRQRALAGIDQQHDAVNHFERALHFAAEVGVAGSIYDVDFYVVVEDGGVLGQDGDAALALQLVGIHDALGHHLIGAEGARLAEHGVHQRGFAVVNVSDDGDVANHFYDQ